MILIIYTSKYRKGSDKFERAAATMKKEITARYNGEVNCTGIIHKKTLAQFFNEISEERKQIDEFHFIGHSGMYGPMFGSVEYPEQFSPYEWRQLHIPFSAEGKAYFHCCRSARWFATFFAQTFRVETFGYYWYTTFSSDKKKFRFVNSSSKEIYAAGCIGRKSHGLGGTLRKYSGFQLLEQMRSFKPQEHTADATYNKVAALYDQVFQDIKVRDDEWKWLTSHLPPDKNITVLDIGCGNGALLKELSTRISQGIGVDLSNDIIDRAKTLNAASGNLSFHVTNGPFLPVADQSVDVIISLLSFRYLDWDPIMNECKRVLKAGGKILIVDMVTVPVKWKEYPLLLKSKLKQYGQRIMRRAFYENLKKLVLHPDWKTMLKYNPIRAEHEVKWYLESRFPGSKVQKINVGWNSCILAFDSGNIENINEIYLTYP
ncbi:MAG TPA: class I SAM-dependent methyltransferase [Chitinophagales bacterium]|nr:class I SAM-dependent methyltransferase [Chitinophagales bacterium]